MRKCVNNSTNGATEKVASSQSGPSTRQASESVAPETLLGVQESKRYDSMEPYKVHWLWKETHARLERLYKRVCEGKFVDEASEFARWLRFTGLLEIFHKYAAPEPLEVSAVKIEKLITDTLFECEQFWKRNPRGPYVALSELEAINHKLDLLAGRIAQLPLAEPAQPSISVLPDVVLFTK